MLCQFSQLHKSDFKIKRERNTKKKSRLLTRVAGLLAWGLRIIKIDGRVVRDGKHRGKVGGEAN
jgi:hypothetical protein